ncbi:unnamed protein product [Paramecium octaurelia]|uniref:Uncharacterized protein n=1 Tax=Paramecium octaurelia TaxID=43137 RepID=A0A8S1YMN4_PAROT|nr:unnamed protein product [Paramecium octaurelia]
MINNQVTNRTSHFQIYDMKPFIIYDYLGAKEKYQNNNTKKKIEKRYKQQLRSGQNIQKTLGVKGKAQQQERSLNQQQNTKKPHDQIRSQLRNISNNSQKKMR